MVNQDAPVASPAQASAPVAEEAGEEQSSKPVAEASQEMLPVSPGAGAVARPAPGGVVPRLLSEGTLTSLEGLITKAVISHGDGLRDARIGAHILCSWARRRSWVLDRMDSFAISAEAWTPRSFTIDLKVPELATITGQDYFLPVEAFPRDDVREVMAFDEHGDRISTLASIEQELAVGSMLIALASIIVNKSVLLSEEDKVNMAIRLAASGGELNPIREIQDEGVRAALLGNDEFMDLAKSLLGREFLCLRTIWGGGNTARHVVRLTYQEAVYPRPQIPEGWLRQAAAQLGIRVTILKVPLPASDGAGHWRLNIAAPVGAELYSCQLTDGRDGDRQADKVVEGRQTTVTFSPRDAYKFLKIEFRISRQWRTWVLTNAVLITLLLAVGAWRIGFVAQNSGDLGTKDLTAAFLLGINGAFAGILARPTDDALASTFLSGIRIAISILGILAFIAVASLAFGPSGHALFLTWLVLASTGGFVFILVFLGSGLWERR
jgi:hypothetical protein